MTRNDTIAFLTCVLPAEGFYCAVVFNTAHPRPGLDLPRQLFFDNIAELADCLIANDRAGRTVYHACASFKVIGNRKQVNAHSARSLWVDIDCDPSGLKGGKPCYVDQQEAAEAVLAFCRAADLPAPLFVDSGFGLHCYWPLEQSLDPDQWRVYAAGLKQLCNANGLLVDPARTADIASILRTPGTHNRKDGERLVRSGDTSLQHHPQVFRDLVATRIRLPDRSHNISKHLVVAQGTGQARTSIISRIESGASYGAVYADDVADRCAQLDLLRQSGGVAGWFLRVGVLAFCTDGEVKAHEWSKNDYPEYDPRVVNDRLVRSRALTGATTCERFHANDPATCERCPLWGKINSPISVPVAPHVLGSNHLERPTNEVTLPEGYREHDGKLWFVKEDNEGEQVETLLCNAFRLRAVQTGELDATAHSYRFTAFLPKKGWNDVNIDARTLFSSAGISEIAGKGVVVHDAKCFLDYVRHAVDDFNAENETQIRYDQFGWKNGDGAFLYGKMLYTSVGPVEAIGAKEVQTRSQWIGPKLRGSVEAWTEAADSLFASDMEAYSAMVLASFAAPLMRFQSQDEGGAILHLFTPGSGQGKTTALTGAWTVWGTKEGLSLTNEDTRVSKPIAIGTLANLPVIYDELRDKDPEYIRRMVVMFTEGRDRMRGMTDGTIRHTKANWQTMMLSAANNSLLDQLTGDGVDAPAFRVLELSSTLPRAIDKTKGDRLKKVLNDNAGHAGDAYLRYLLHPPVLDFARKSLEQWTQEIWDVTRLDSAHRFRVRAVGAIAVASALVNKLGILHFNTDRILSWLVKELGHSNNKGTVTQLTTLENAISEFGEFINAHYGEMLVVSDRWRPREPRMVPFLKPHNRLSMRFEIKPQRLLISEAAFRNWAVDRGVSPRVVLDTLEQHQVIVARKRGVTLSAGTDIPGAQVMCIEANAAHPVMSGLVASITELQKEEANG